MKLSDKTLESKIKSLNEDEKFEFINDLISKQNYSNNQQLDFIKTLKKIGEDQNNAIYKIRALINFGEFYRQNENNLEQRKAYEKAAAISNEIGHKSYYAQSLRGIGTSFFDKQNYKKAEFYFRKSYDFTKNNQTLIQEHIWAIIRIGNCLSSNLRKDEAMQIYMSGIALAKENESLKLPLASLYSNIATTVHDNTRIDYLKKSSKIFEEFNDVNSLVPLYADLAGIYCDLKNYDELFVYANKALKFAKISKAPAHLIRAYSILIDGLTLKVSLEKLTNLDLIEEAEFYLEQLKPIIKKSDRLNVKLEFELREAVVYFYKKDYSIALKKLLTLYEKLTNESESILRRNVTLHLFMTYEKLKNFEKALFHYKIYTDERNKIVNNQSKKLAEDLVAKYETKEKENEVKRLQELEELKARFFSQITHELRTPLTLILGPAQQIPKIKNYEEINHQAAVIERNADRLLQLVNQLLDLSKLEADKMQLKVREGSFSIFVQRLLNAFQHLATQQQIQLDFINDMDQDIFVLFDADKVEKIIYNLLSNAFKFTATQGRIVCQLSDNQSNETNTRIEFIVSDTGKGISTEALPHIFDRFYQADDSYTREAEGTGIGLSLVKEMTNLMNGTIEVASKVGEGTTFTLSLPMQIAEGEQHIESDYSPSSQPLPIPAQTPSDTSPKTEETPVLLLIEDNRDMHGYIKSIFQDEYIILQAYDGNEGIELAKKRIPDLIISDVMMPEKDGYQVCQELKNDRLTNHIPIILLTAKAALKSRIEGFEHGADAYISKPFSAEELLLQVQNLIATAQNMREQYAQSDASQSSNIQPVFLQQVTEIIGQNIHDDQLNAERLSALIHLSRSQLYRKIKALTGYNISEFIRIARLNRAKILLEQQAGNVSQIAYDVGLQPGYLSRSFTKHFGYSPKSLLKS